MLTKITLMKEILPPRSFTAKYKGIADTSKIPTVTRKFVAMNAEIVSTIFFKENDYKWHYYKNICNDEGCYGDADAEFFEEHLGIELN